MELEILLVAIIALILYNRYVPKLDLFRDDNGKWKLLLWYNRYDFFNEYERAYIRIF